MLKSEYDINESQFRQTYPKNILETSIARDIREWNQH